MKKYYLLLILLLSSSTLYADEKLSFGIGLGVPYGLLGGNMNYQLNSFVDLTAGLGLGGIGAGFRFHPVSSIPKIRITTYYGPNAGIKNSNDDGIEVFNGLNIGFGYGALSRGWDFDVMYIMLSDDVKNRVKALESQGYSISGDTDNKIALSVGYHW